MRGDVSTNVGVVELACAAEVEFVDALPGGVDMSRAAEGENDDAGQGDEMK